MDEMKRNLLINSFFITFGIIFAISAQDKSPKNVEKNVKVIIKDGKVITDTVIRNEINGEDFDFISMEDSTVNVLVIKEGPSKKKIIEIRPDKGAEKEAHIETIVGEDGDSMLVKSFVFSNGFDKEIVFKMPDLPVPPHMPHLKFTTKSSDPVEMLLNDPDYEILDYDKKVRKGVETIKIKRIKTEK